MGNALNSVGKAIDAKFLGTNPLESKFAVIDEGIKDVKAWKDNIDKQRLELKQNTAKQIREAEKYAFENMPNNETAKARILKDLAKYKDQMLMNERLVRNGAISPEENLISPAGKSASPAETSSIVCPYAVHPVEAVSVKLIEEAVPHPLLKIVKTETNSV